MIRVLQVVGKMRRAGQETFLMNVYRNIDAEKVQFDFLVHTREECAYDAEILERGGHIYHIKRVQENPLFYLRDIARVVREHHYDIVQCHTAHAMGCLVLLGAWLGGASVRILHSHSTRAYPIWLHRLIRPFAYRLAGYHLACSQAAGEWMYGAKRKFQIIYSGIDTGQYCYDEECRKHIRRQLGLDEKIVVGHIGRLNRYKNYDFLLQVFAEVHRQNSETVLLLVGQGEEEEHIRQWIHDFKLEKAVLLLGEREDIPALLLGMDILVAPSVFEGFGMTVLEGQASGLPCVVSAQVCRENKVTDLITYLPITPVEQQCREWAEMILQIAEETKRKPRFSRAEEIQKAGMDAETAAGQLEAIYLQSSASVSGKRG